MDLGIEKHDPVCNNRCASELYSSKMRILECLRTLVNIFINLYINLLTDVIQIKKSITITQLEYMAN